MVDKSIVGTEMGGGSMVVERGKIMEFARAILDENPVYFEENAPAPPRALARQAAIRTTARFSAIPQLKGLLRWPLPIGPTSPTPSSSSSPTRAKKSPGPAKPPAWSSIRKAAKFT